MEYVEPFAGGAAVGLSLLFEERASRIHINDLNPAVHAFWHTVLEHNAAFCARIQSTRVSLAEWRRQREVYVTDHDADSTDLGFAAFFLNRTNRSGILGGGVIGGKAQKSEWGVGARYNKTDLVQRIQKIGRYANRVSLSNQDALHFVNEKLPILGDRAFTFFDPPYIENGEDLYLNNFKLDDHKALANRIAQLDGHWMVTYDYAAAREGLYAGHRRIIYDLPYSAQARYQGKEVMFLSPSLKIPESWKRGPDQIQLASEASRHPLRGRMEVVKAVRTKSTAARAV